MMFSKENENDKQTDYFGKAKLLCGKAKENKTE